MIPADPDWRPIPFSTIWMGHLITGIVANGGIFVALIILFKLFLTTVPASDVLFIVVVGWLLTETLSSLVDRLLAQHYRRDNPGGVIAAAGRIAIFISIYSVLGFVFLPTTFTIILCAGVAGVATVIETLALKSWEPGMTRAEVRQAWVDTKEMTEEVFKNDN